MNVRDIIIGFLLLLIVICGYSFYREKKLSEARLVEAEKIRKEIDELTSMQKKELLSSFSSILFYIKAKEGKFPDDFSAKTSEIKHFLGDRPYAFIDRSILRFEYQKTDSGFILLEIGHGENVGNSVKIICDNDRVRTEEVYTSKYE